MNVVFLNGAEQELLEAALFYEKQALGLGKCYGGGLSVHRLYCEVPAQQPKTDRRYSA